MFDRTGQLVTTSNDGFVRLYAANRYADPIARFEMGGHDPQSAAFSPDGKRVAVGFEDIPKVVVLSGADLTRLFEANTATVGKNGISSVGWSQDGRFLFAGGEWYVNRVNQVRRWSRSGRGAFVDIPAAPEPIVEILGLKSDSMLFAHLHGFGLIRPDSGVTPLHGLGGLDVGSDDGPLISRDGGTVQIGGLDVQADELRPNSTHVPFYIAGPSGEHRSASRRQAAGANHAGAGPHRYELGRFDRTGGERDPAQALPR